MKKNIFIYLVWLLAGSSLLGQSCLPGGIIFSTQGQVDSFPINYPNCNVIEGNLEISGLGNPSITNLQSLSQITQIDGDLTISGSELLPNLTGLEGLTSVGGKLFIGGNDALSSLVGLDNLLSVGAGIWISYNTVLTDISALGNITVVHERLQIENNDMLMDLNGLHNIITVENLNLLFNPLIADLSPLSSLESVTNSFLIDNMPALLNFADLQSLTSIGGLFTIGLPAGGGNGIQDLTGLEGLTSLHKLEMFNNNSLVSLNGLNNITTVEEVLTIFTNPALSSLSGLESLSSVGQLSIYDNDNLVNLTGLENLTSADQISCQNNANLETLTGLNSLETISTKLKIFLNNSLVSLAGLENLTSISGDLTLEENVSLADISALSNADLTGLESLFIHDNHELATCGQESICNYILAGGAAIIDENAPGCDSMNEVIQSCIVFVDHTSFVGNVYTDIDQDCLPGAGDTGIPNVLVQVENDTLSYAVSTDSLGNYFIPVLAGDYTLSVISPSSFWTTCFSDTILTATAMNDSIITDFFLSPLGDCAYLEWDVIMPPLRVCDDRPVVISYCNYGAQLAEDVIISLDLDPFMTVTSSSIPFTIDTDGSLLFEIDTLALFECDQIVMDVFLDCDSVDVNELLCVDVEIMSEELCSPDSLWDGSIVTATGFCENDSIYFELENIGSGSMGEPAQFRVEILIDDIVLLHDVDNYQLLTGDSIILSYELDGNGLRIEADQTPGHPLYSEASAIVPSCDDILNELILTLFPMNNGDPFSETFCTFAVNSYDPNIKTATPIGIGDDHEIDKDWELDYTIQFQNTGNDVAYLVVIKDTLSENLDLTTLSVRGASHPFTWALNPNRELVFTFDDILLPDSTTNEPESHGYVQFSISPKAGLLPGETIENNAGIYFDFNDPIITNTVLHTIKKPIVASSEKLDWCAGEAFEGQVIWEDTTFQHLTSFIEYDSIHFIHLKILPQVTNIASADVVFGEYFQGVLIENDTNFVISYTGQNGCDSLVSYTVSVIIDVEEIDSSFKAVEIYPNPVSNVLFLLNQQNGEAQQWTFFNSIGEIVWQKTLAKNERMPGVSVDGFPRGVYWLEVKTERGGAVWKVVVQ